MTPFLNKETPTLGSADRSRGLPGEERPQLTCEPEPPGRPAPRPPQDVRDPLSPVHTQALPWPATATHNTAFHRTKTRKRRRISRTIKMK